MKNKHLFHFNKVHCLYALSDFIIVAAFVMFAFLSKYSSDIFADYDSKALIFMLAYTFGSALLTVVVFYFAHVYKMLTRTFGLSSAIYIAIVTLIVQVVGFVALFIYQKVFHESRISVWSWLLCAFCVCGALPSLRLAPRFINIIKVLVKNRDSIRTIVIGGGQCGKLLVDEMINNPQSRNRIVAIVDDDEMKIGSFLGNIPVIGPIADIASFVNTFDAEEVIIAISHITDDRVKEIARYLEGCSVRIKRMASLSDNSGPNDIKTFKVDIGDLLYRDAVQLDNTSISGLVHNKVVLVTGAGGSIGSELVRQLFLSRPKQLILFDIYENSTYDIEQELKTKMRQENIDNIELVTLIGSTYNEKRVEQIIAKYRPDYIYHAAAYKHVPLMEDSPQEAIRTNVIGTYNVAKYADKYKVKKMVLVSTDKAVRPTNVMGATKRFAELVVQHFSKTSKNTIYACVRFGNVLGSNGSVIPLFKKQIENGGPVTITDKNIIRYFMSIPEAVSLILQCSIFATKGEIFILDMGKPVKIIDLAEKLIRQAGYIPYKDINIVCVGLRPGEKLYEELLLDKGKHRKTNNNKIYIEDEITDIDIDTKIKEISDVFDLTNNNEIKTLLANIITSYTIDKRS